MLVHHELSTIHIAQSVLGDQAIRTGRRGIHASLTSWGEDRIVVGGHVLHIKEFTVTDTQIVVVAFENIHHLAAVLFGI
jgi:uncharacterized protein (DUF1330 family)